MLSTPPLNNRPRLNKQIGAVGSVFVLILTTLVLSLSLFVVLNRQLVLDAVHFWSYQPSTEIAAIVTRSELTNEGIFKLYATRPSIEHGQEFNEHCDRKEENVAVIGCYVNDRIYLYDVKDTRLDGIKEVTAAHEMLHAAYERLSKDEKSRINALIEVEYQRLSADPDFEERMAFYARTEPGERDNELHSIIGTEIDGISIELEQHYAKYFANRDKILRLHSGYNLAFVELERKAKALSVELDQLSDEIDSEMSRYNNEVKQLNEQIADFNRRAANGGFSSQSAFNSERQALQKRVEDLNDLRDSINGKVARYEVLRSQYNDTVTQSQDLYKSIDSLLEPAPSV